MRTLTNKKTASITSPRVASTSGYVNHDNVHLKNAGTRHKSQGILGRNVIFFKQILGEGN